VATRFPDLTPSGCKVLIVCGKTEDSEAVSKMKNLKNLAAVYRTGGHPAHVRAVFETNGKYGHLHLELVSKEYWDKAGDPKAVDKIADIQTTLEKLQGITLRADVDGYFAVPLNDLPPFIRSATEEVRVRGVSIKMTKGTLALSGAPIEEIEWRTAPSKQEALIILHSNKAVQITPDFLINALSIIAPAFSVLIQGRRADAGKDK
jgi:hypothetical protein